MQNEDEMMNFNIRTYSIKNIYLVPLLSAFLMHEGVTHSTWIFPLTIRCHIPAPTPAREDWVGPYVYWNNNNKQTSKKEYIFTYTHSAFLSVSMCEFFSLHHSAFENPSPKTSWKPFSSAPILQLASWLFLQAKPVDMGKSLQQIHFLFAQCFMFSRRFNWDNGIRFAEVPSCEWSQ